MAVGPVAVHLPPADGLGSVVTHAPCAVHPAPKVWVPHRLAYANNLQWPTLLGATCTDAHMCRALAHPRQPSTPHGAHSKTAGLLHSLPTGASCSLDGYIAPSPARPPLPCYQGLECYLSCRAPL